MQINITNKNLYSPTLYENTTNRPFNFAENNNKFTIIYETIESINNKNIINAIIFDKKDLQNSIILKIET